ncbi:hypothetical protein CY34DRAFT_136600 [Suillus luteus UH-Slu-Lm8-n1]|uniref:Uncharacterized protein n=1 Tax=Suillus luteus UH-Slu-Lm8-n1 TaxID=930992 RepID=A0A0D0A347_9AGAM|nr:hypothetical protein CY34DRAFT_136600 [Suillus luteus UH-Slu-Lm8-n1]
MTKRPSSCHGQALNLTFLARSISGLNSFFNAELWSSRNQLSKSTRCDTLIIHQHPKSPILLISAPIFRIIIISCLVVLAWCVFIQLSFHAERIIFMVLSSSPPSLRTICRDYM